jgi:hypothetical protein
MEYLMTYGWAILIIAIVLAALFQLGVFNPMSYAPKAPPGACQVFRPNGPGTTQFINLEGICTGEIPQYVASFGASPAYVLISDDPKLPTAAAASRTITVWIDPTTGARSTVFTQPNQGNLDVCGVFNLLISYPSAGQLFLHKCLNDIGVSIVSHENVWQFVAVVYNNASDTVTFYVNNQNVSVTNNGMYSATQNLTLGGWDYYAPTMAGYMSNFQIYNTSLSASDIQALYQEGIGGAPIDLQNLEGWWPLNGNANDYSGNGYNGVPHNVTFTGSWYSSYTPP